MDRRDATTRTRRRAFLPAMALALALGQGGASAGFAQEEGTGRGEAGEEPGGYELVMRSAGGAWRLDTRTGQVCLFEFPASRPGATVLNAGCFPPKAGEEGGPTGRPGRYEAAPHAKGDLWRLDTATGRVCLFAYVPVHTTAPVVLQGCSSEESLGM